MSRRTVAALAGALAVALTAAVAGFAAQLDVSSNNITAFTLPPPTTTTSSTTSSTTTPADTTAPSLTLLQMFDTNLDGVVETVEATFNEMIACQGGTCATARWSIAGAPSGTGAGVSAVTVSGTKATITIAGGTTKNTGVGTFTVTLSNASGGAIQDAAGNRAGFAAQAPADKARPVPLSITLVNPSGATAGQIDEKKDRADIVFSEAISAASVCSAAAGDVTATVTEASANDVLTVTATGCTVHFGSLNLKADYVSATSTWGPGTGTGNNSAVSVVTDTILRVEFGQRTSIALRVGVSTSQPTYTPDSAITDTAGNGVVATPFTATALSRF